VKVKGHSVLHLGDRSASGSMGRDPGSHWKCGLMGP